MKTKEKVLDMVPEAVQVFVGNLDSKERAAANKNPELIAKAYRSGAIFALSLIREDRDDV